MLSRVTIITQLPLPLRWYFGVTAMELVESLSELGFFGLELQFHEDKLTVTERVADEEAAGMVAVWSDSYNYPQSPFEITYCTQEKQHRVAFIIGAIRQSLNKR